MVTFQFKSIDINQFLIGFSVEERVEMNENCSEGNFVYGEVNCKPQTVSGKQRW